MTRITVNDNTFEIEGENIAIVNKRIIADGVDVTDAAKQADDLDSSTTANDGDEHLIYPATKESKRQQ